ncbi:lipoprotein [Geomonas silvestris]|uniref:Lipoprotein n=1 Tax=Geomonas silvestris TaxID=2740184 RepID=A0A6V8MKM9_9BACT|nr:hypothetical protein [Geomonas silvestris]GFO60522.1 lipoprotein [Geomonas silvestris]
MATCSKPAILFLRLFVIVLLLSCVACNSETGEQRQVKAAVMRYTDQLASCYKNMDMNPMQLVATADHAAKLYSHMAALGEGRVRLESKLKTVAFDSISFPKPESAAVRTTETWDFVHVNIDHGQRSLEKKDFPYQVSYELKKEGDRWLVAATSVSTALAQQKTNGR